MRKKYWCILILIILTTTCSLFAWGPVGHYAIARESGITHNKAGLYNLPDAWDSWALIVVNLNEPNANIFEITDFFCWSHAVARNPKSWSFYGIVPVRVPSIPKYHLEREPGQIIQAFIDQNKVARWRTEHGNIPVERTQAKDTAIFFTGHNAADYHVHWSYFGGNSVDGWLTGHKTKEEWSDYAILISRHQITFTLNGNIATFWDSPMSSTIYSMPLPQEIINLRAIRLAQLAARKNRFFLDEKDFSQVSKSPNAFNDVETITSIRERITNLEDEINNIISHFSIERWLELKEIALKNGWMYIIDDAETGRPLEDFSALLKMFNLAKKRFQSFVP